MLFAWAEREGGEGFDAIIVGVGSVGKQSFLLFRLFSHNSRDIVCNLLAISEMHYRPVGFETCGSSNFALHSSKSSD